MHRVRCILRLALLGTTALLSNAKAPTAAGVASDLRHLSLDPKQTYRVRDLQLVRGDIKIYLNEGVLSLFKPVAEHRVAAVFTTEGAEAGDAEIIVMPPQRSERASLAFFTKAPNLDEHFNTALFYFTDDTAHELLGMIDRSPVREAPELAEKLASRVEPVAGRIAGQIDVPLIEAALDNHRLTDGIFYGVISGNTLGAFDVTYDPLEREPVYVGRVSDSREKGFQLWTNFRPRKAPPFVEPQPKIRDYRIESTVGSDLDFSAVATFKVKTSAEDGRVLALGLSPRLAVNTATIDGVRVEVLQHPSHKLAEFGSSETLLLVADQAINSAVDHEVQLNYSGAIIRRLPNGEYVVDERNSWYPVNGPVRANFDLTFHCPGRLHLVSTGELANDDVENGIRTVHRKTITPAALAGFNLGEYNIEQEQHKPYAIEIYSSRETPEAVTQDAALFTETASILQKYTKEWTTLPIRSVAVTPIAGYFGQGFPGLIYLSSVAYIKQEKRSPALRNPRFDAFFSELLLPHEIAHQWWGNIVRQADDRSNWITEAMANASALKYIEQTKTVAARDDILESYREDLTKKDDGRTVESAGPVNFGQRLIDNFGVGTWHIILYEKGSWIMHMLRERLGNEKFREAQLQLLREYAGRPLSNEDFRKVLSSFVPAGQPDRSLNSFFETWVYGTGIPSLSLRGTGRTVEVEVAGVDNDYMVEIPLRCRGGAVHWVRAGFGDNTFDLPSGVSSCELPSSRDFLYMPGKGR